MRDTPERSYAEWSLALHHRCAGRRVPLQGTFEITRRCNMRCAHCYNNLPLGAADARRGELPLEDHRRILDEAAEAGCLWVLFTGGEVFTRPDFLDIYEHARGRGMLVTIFTNATLVDAVAADRLGERRPFSIEVSIYGSTARTHDRVTGVPGSFGRCRRGIGLLLERGLPVQLKTMALTLNRHELDGMRRLAEEDLGVGFRFDAMLNPRLDGRGGPLDVRLSPEEVVALDLADERRLRAWRAFCVNRPARKNDGGGSTSLYRCGAGRQSFAVDPAGGMSLCGFSVHDGFDLTEHSFAEGWEGFLPTRLERKASRENRCAACGLAELCGMCPANGLLEGGDEEKPVDFLCRTAHLRAEAFGVARGQ